MYTRGCMQGHVVLRECFLDRAIHEPGFHREADRSVDWQAEGLSLEQENSVPSSTEVQTPDPLQRREVVLNAWGIKSQLRNEDGWESRGCQKSGFARSMINVRLWVIGWRAPENIHVSNLCL